MLEVIGGHGLIIKKQGNKGKEEVLKTQSEKDPKDTRLAVQMRRHFLKSTAPSV